MTRQNIIKEFEVDIGNINKIETLCDKLLNHYLDKDRVYFLPEWKPSK